MELLNAIKELALFTKTQVGLLRHKTLNFVCGESLLVLSIIECKQSKFRVSKSLLYPVCGPLLHWLFAKAVNLT